MAPTSSYPSLTNKIGAESTTLLSIVMTITTKNTVKMPILKAVGFFVISEYRYPITDLQVLQQPLRRSLSSNSLSSSLFWFYRRLLQSQSFPSSILSQPKSSYTRSEPSGIGFRLQTIGLLSSTSSMLILRAFFIPPSRFSCELETIPISRLLFFGF